MERMKKEVKLLHDIYRECYAQSTPKGDYDKMFEVREFNFNNYYCPIDVQQRIFDEKTVNVKSQYIKRKLRLSFMLGISPCSADFHFRLYCSGKSLKEGANRVKWGFFKEGNLIETSDYPKVGSKLILYDKSINNPKLILNETIEIVTPTEITPQSCNTIIFKTKNNTFELHREINR